MITNTSNVELISANKNIPYFLISEESNDGSFVQTELSEILKYYLNYKRGVDFTTEGSNGDYVPSELRYNIASNLVNKEARFMFANPPDIVVKPKVSGLKMSKEVANSINIINGMLNEILDKNNFNELLIKASKDCFIGKRVAALVNVNKEDGVTINFLNSTQFLFESKSGDSDLLTKFVGFITINDSSTLSKRKLFKKKYWVDEESNVHLHESLYDGAGKLIEVVTDDKVIEEIDRIPAVIIINDGLSNESNGRSDLEGLSYFEESYNRLSNSDIDSNRKSMNAIRYVVDMDSQSTKNLSTAPGALWDLGSDQNLENEHPAIGMLEPSMKYSESLKSTLERIKTAAHDKVDVPNINLETMSGVITSGKGLKAIYWGLDTRCKEKFLTWGPRLQTLIEIIIESCFAFPSCVERYIEIKPTPVPYRVEVTGNNPIPEDEQEEKNMDLAEVESKTMSKKSYMKKWRGLSDEEVEEELKQIALERELVEDSFMPSEGTLKAPYEE
jgi:phage portal protein, SPP1 gp6-like